MTMAARSKSPSPRVSRAVLIALSSGPNRSPKVEPDVVTFWMVSICLLIGFKSSLVVLG
jgi:hypothetical protein